MHTSRVLLASLFLAAIVAVPVYAHISFNTPKCETCAQCDGNCASCPNTDCRNNPNHNKGGSDKSDSNKAGKDKAGSDKAKDEAPAKK